MKKIFCFLFVLLICFDTYCFASDTVTDEQIINEQFKVLNIENYNKQAKDILNKSDETSNNNDLDLETLSREAMEGNLDISLSGLLEILVKGLFSGISGNIDHIRNIIVIALLAAFLKNLDNSFSGSAIGELGFYICYVTMVVSLLLSFNEAFGITKNVITQMADFMQALLPLFIALLMGAGSYGTSFAFQPIAIGAIEVITVVIKDIVLYVVVLGGLLKIVNFIMPKQVLEKMANLIDDGIQVSLKSMMALLGTVVTIQGVSAPIAGGFLTKGTKMAVGAIPVVGDALTGAVDSVFYWSNAVKNGVSVGSLIFIGAFCFAPVIKMAVMFIVYKIVAAIIQPVCDERIVNCIDSTANFIGLLILSVLCTAVMFVILVMMVIMAGTG